jgi:hypothetical protein
MSESDDNKSAVPATINAVSNLVDKVPVYQDLVQPVAIQAGEALGTVGRVVNVALMPVKGLVWGAERIEEFVQSKLTSKLANIPPENIQAPDISIAGPAIESLRFTGDKESISELYANLLATSMDKTTARTAHPGFVEIIRNLSGDEAKILSHLITSNYVPLVDIHAKWVERMGHVVVSAYVSTVGSDSGCEHSDLVSASLRNLERLGLIDMPKGSNLTAEGIYDRILNDPAVKKIEHDIDAGVGTKTEFEKYYAAPSVLGKLFIAACVDSRDKP